MKSSFTNIELTLPSDLEELVQEDCEALEVSINQVGTRLFEAWVKGEIGVYTGKKGYQGIVLKDNRDTSLIDSLRFWFKHWRKLK